MKKAQIDHLVLGMVSTNTWFLKNTETSEVLIIDPADQVEWIKRKVQDLQGIPKAVLLTHGHFDHILAAGDLKDFYGIPIYALEAEKTLMADARMNLSGSWSDPYTLEADGWMEEGQMLSLAGFEIQVLHTPGHTAGSCCFYIKEEGILFSGDTLFCCSVGRTDFPTSNGRQMRESLHRLLEEIPDETRVFSGHGEDTTIAYEKRYNPFA